MRLSAVLRSWFGAALFLAFTAGLAAQSTTVLTAGTVGQAYSASVVGPSGSTYAITGLPISSGLSLNATSGALTGTPQAAATYTGIISVTSNGNTTNVNYSLTINGAAAAPAITSATTATATAGSAFSYTVTASNAPTSFNVGTLPAGLSFNSATSVIDGTPTTAGTYSVTLSANNSAGTGSTVTLTITVSPSGPVPVISSATTASGTLVPASSPASFTVNYQMAASNSPVAYAASGLPLGISVNTGTGLISGTTTVQGVYSVSLTATNNNGTSATATLTLTVGSLSVITSSSAASAISGAAFNFLVSANNSAQSFNVGGLPTGLSFNTTNGAITGSVSAVGTYAVTLSANNAVGVGPTSTLTITVAAGGGGGGGGGVFVLAPQITSATSLAVLSNTAFTFPVVTSPAATSFSLAGDVPTGVSINATTGVITGTVAQTGTYGMVLIATNTGGLASTAFVLTVNARPVITAQPVGGSATVGGNVTLSVVATGTPTPTYQWNRNGVAISGATLGALTLTNFQVADAGAYTVTITNSVGAVTSRSAAVGVTSTAKVAGAGTEIGTNITHANGNVYDQVLLTGAAAVITADAGQVTRVSFIDLNDDIVQVEFSGAGTLALTLENASGPAAPVKYNQPGVLYMKGHASLVITGANESTNVSVFSVGAVTAVNQALFPVGMTYDGVADIGLISIATTNGKFGGVRTANASYFRSSGLTGVNAPGVAMQGPVYVGDITADADATGTLVFASTTDVRVTGGDLLQLNNRAVQVDGITQLSFTAGAKSSGAVLPVQLNRGRLEQNGVDVTNLLVK
jgi:hypothetical protein